MDYLMGSIIWVAFTFAPQGTLEANGQCMTINKNEALYSLLGNRFGGNPSSNFCLPDLRPKGADGKPDPNWNGGPRAVIVKDGIYPQHPW